MTTECWFPTPIYFSGFDGKEYESVSDEIQTVVNKVLSEDKHQFLSDASKIGSKPLNNTYIIKEQLFDHYNLPLFKKGIDRFVREYVADIQPFDLPANYSLQYTESWLNVLDEEQYHQTHAHRHCDISGVYYHTVPQGSGKIVFETPLAHVETGNFPYGNLSSGSITHEPEAGKILLFPYWARHNVQKGSESFNNQHRISIAFNLKLVADN